MAFVGRDLLGALLQPGVEAAAAGGHQSKAPSPDVAPAGNVVPITTTSCGNWSSRDVVDPVIHSPMAIVFEVPSVTDWIPIAGPKT